MGNKRSVLKRKILFTLYLLISVSLIQTGGYSQSAAKIAAALEATLTPAQLTTIMTPLITNINAGNINTIAANYNAGSITLAQANAQILAELQAEFPGVNSGISTRLLTAQSSITTILNNDFSGFLSAFSKYYGDALLLTAHLTNPIGFDSLKTYPAYSLGLGSGTAFSNVNQLKKSGGSDATSLYSGISVLPTLGITINGAIAVSEKVTLYLALFPTSQITLPVDQAKLKNYNLKFRYGSYRGRIAYNLHKPRLFGIGFTLGGFLGYNYGELTLETSTIQGTPISYTATNATAEQNYSNTTIVTPEYTSSIKSSWSHFSFGPEIKTWLNFGFLVPYAGYGLAFQFGSTTSSLTLDSTMKIENGFITSFTSDGKTVSSSNTDTTDFTTTISEKESARYFLHRFILGVEIHIATVRIGAEIDIDPVSRFTGISAGFAVAF